jgi:hypothetical protein
VVGGALSAVSTWRNWAVCRPDISTPACRISQDRTSGLPLWGDVGHRDTWGTALAALAAVLLGLAWLAVGGWAGRNAARTAVVAIVGLQPLILAALVSLELVMPGRFSSTVTNGWLTWPAEVCVIPMLLGAGWLLDEGPVLTLRLILLGWGVTSFGSIHHLIDYMTSKLLSTNVAGLNPGLGYVTAATQLGLGATVAIISLTLRDRTEPDGDEDELGPDGFTLAA